MRTIWQWYTYAYIYTIFVSRQQAITRVSICFAFIQEALQNASTKQIPKQLKVTEGIDAAPASSP